MAITSFALKLLKLNLSLWSVTAFALGGAVHSQSMGSSTASRLTIQGPAEASGTSVIRDALGKPCLDVEAAARGHVVHPETLDHLVSIKNNCPRSIKVKVCYYGSDRCNDVIVQQYGRVDTILGTMTGVKTFRYSVSQK